MERDLEPGLVEVMGKVVALEVVVEEEAAVASEVVVGLVEAVVEEVVA